MHSRIKKGAFHMEGAFFVLRKYGLIRRMKSDNDLISASLNRDLRFKEMGGLPAARYPLSAACFLSACLLLVLRTTFPAREWWDNKTFLPGPSF